MKYAWIENDVVRDICPGHPDQHYTPQVAAFYNTQIPDDIQMGATLVGGTWTNPAVVHIEQAEMPALPKLWTASDIRSAMSLLERVKWDNASSGSIVTAKLEFASAQTADMIAPVLQMLVDSGDITQETMNKILA
jgi:hypothetical protein